MNLFLTELGYFGPYILTILIGYYFYRDHKISTAIPSTENSTAIPSTENSTAIPSTAMSIEKDRIISPELFFIACAILNETSNRVLKQIIKQPRPQGINYINYWDSFDNAKKHYYGMPSGHAQNVASAATFLILYTNNTYLAIYAIAQVLLTLYQRYYYRKHTIGQLCVGTILGTTTGIIYYKLFQKYVKI